MNVSRVVSLCVQLREEPLKIWTRYRELSFPNGRGSRVAGFKSRVAGFKKVAGFEKVAGFQKIAL